MKKDQRKKMDVTVLEMQRIHHRKIQGKNNWKKLTHNTDL